MKNALVRSKDDVASASRVFHRRLDQAAAFGRPGGGRRKPHETTSVVLAARALVER